MYDPISVDTALVSANGDLLISLTDGNIVNAGKVRGAQGIQGERGFIGERGEPGRDGIDGAQWHTGVGMPDLDLGTAGDLYMDVANSLLPIYQKVGNDWLLLCNLKVPPSGGGGGSGGAAGGGGSVILFPSPLPGVPGPDKPTVDNDGNSLNKGDVWFDTTTGWLYVWNGSQWVAVSDRPPVIISPTPPDYNNASDENPAKNPQYPVREGDLWFDSDQLATYVAVLNSSNELIWVIATPHNREGLASEIPAGRGLAEHTFPAAIDKQIEYNLVTDTNYIYNAAKKQWIDISQMVHYGAKPPAFAPKGALFTDEATLKQFVQIDQNVWVENTSCGAGPGTPVLGKLTYIQFTKYAMYTFNVAHNGGVGKGATTEIFWASAEGPDFYDGDYYWELDLNGDDSWVKVEDTPQDDLDKIGYRSATDARFNYLVFDFILTTPHPDYPCAKVRLTASNYSNIDSTDFSVETSAATPLFPTQEYSGATPSVDYQPGCTP